MGGYLKHKTILWVDMEWQGRILVFHVRENKLHLISEKEVKGAVYNVNPFQVGSIVFDSLLLMSMTQAMPALLSKHCMIHSSQ